MGAAGAAALTAACGLHTIAPNSACTQSVTYTVGDIVNDSLSSSDCKVPGTDALADYYAFVVSSSEDLRITLSSPAARTFLQLYDSRNAIIMNSTFTVTPDTATAVHVILGQGSYLLAVNAVTPGQTTPYRLVIGTDTTAITGCGPVWVTPGAVSTQAITNKDCTIGPEGSSYYWHRYLVVLLQAQEVNLLEHATAFAPQVYLVGSGGSFGSTVDSTGTNAQLTATIATQGAYNLWVGSANPSQFGTYTLQVR